MKMFANSIEEIMRSKTVEGSIEDWNNYFKEKNQESFYQGELQQLI